MYYSAMCLTSERNREDVTRALDLLGELLAKHPTSLIKIIEEGEDFRVDSFVPGKIAEIQDKYLRGTLKNPILNVFHGDNHKTRFSNAMIIMWLGT